MHGGEDTSLEDCASWATAVVYVDMRLEAMGSCPVRPSDAAIAMSLREMRVSIENADFRVPVRTPVAGQLRPSVFGALFNAGTYLRAMTRVSALMLASSGRGSDVILGKGYVETIPMLF